MRGRLAAAGLVLLITSGLTGCEWLTGSRFQVQRVLGDLSRTPVTGKGTRLSATFASDTVQVTGNKAIVFARAEVNGTFRGVETTCVCIEKLDFRREAGSWIAPDFPLPRLAGVVAALEGRLAALEADDLEGYMGLVSPDYEEDGVDHVQVETRIREIMARTDRPQQTIVARAIRVDKEGAIVTETWQLTAEVDGKPVAHEGRARYHLEPSPSGWRFVSGLL